MAINLSSEVRRLTREAGNFRSCGTLSAPFCSLRPRGAARRYPTLAIASGCASPASAAQMPLAQGWLRHRIGRSAVTVPATAGSLAPRPIKPPRWSSSALAVTVLLGVPIAMLAGVLDRFGSVLPQPIAHVAL
nr:hypothetical protein [uncultured Actinoplanes sp.]